MKVDSINFNQVEEFIYKRQELFTQFHTQIIAVDNCDGELSELILWGYKGQRTRKLTRSKAIGSAILDLFTTNNIYPRTLAR